MFPRSVVPMLALAALVPIALSLHAKAAVRPVSVEPPREKVAVDGLRLETVRAAATPLLPQTSRSREAAPGTLAASLAGHPPPAERTKAPTHDEWRAADGLNVDGEPRCTAYRVREWLRLRCDIERTQQIALLGGARDGTYFGVRRASKDDWWGATKDDIVLPLRRGDHRVIGVTTAEMGRYSAGGPVTETLISEQWLDGEAPIVVVQ